MYGQVESDELARLEIKFFLPGYRDQEPFGIVGLILDTSYNAFLPGKQCHSVNLGCKIRVILAAEAVQIVASSYLCGR